MKENHTKSKIGNFPNEFTLTLYSEEFTLIDSMDCEGGKEEINRMIRAFPHEEYLPKLVKYIFVSADRIREIYEYSNGKVKLITAEEYIKKRNKNV